MVSKSAESSCTNIGRAETNMKDLEQCDVAVYTAACVAMAKQMMYLLLMGTAALTLLFVASSTRSSWYDRGGNKDVVSALGPAAPSACCASSIMLVAACPRRSGFRNAHSIFHAHHDQHDHCLSIQMGRLLLMADFTEDNFVIWHP